MKSSFFNLYLLSCMALLSLEAMNPSKVELAINCGGEEVRSHSGIRYLRVILYLTINRILTMKEVKLQILVLISK